MIKKSEILLILFISVILISCDTNEYDSEDDFEDEDYSADNRESEYYDEEEKDTLGYTIISGKEYFDSAQIELEIEATEQALDIAVKIDLGDSVVFPIYHDDLHGDMTASALWVVMTFESGDESFSLSGSESMNDGKVDLDFHVRTSHFRNFSAGLHDFNVIVEGDFITTFDVKSGEKPIYAEIIMSYKVPELYQSTFYFKSLKLDKESVTNLLGENDHRNSTPEPGIYVSCNGEFIIMGYKENSYEYKEKLQADFYHLSPDDVILIRVVDKDYGFNSDDDINEILLPIKDLESETYKKYSMEHVEELWIYCKQHGKIN